jgi:hypothetical protein
MCVFVKYIAMLLSLAARAAIPQTVDNMQSVLSKFVDARHQILLCNLTIGVKEDVFAKLSEASGQALLGWAWPCFKSHHLLCCCSGVGVVVADA